MHRQILVCVCSFAAVVVVQRGSSVVLHYFTICSPLSPHLASPLSHLLSVLQQTLWVVLALTLHGHIHTHIQMHMHMHTGLLVLVWYAILEFAKQ